MSNCLRTVTRKCQRFEPSLILAHVFVNPPSLPSDFVTMLSQFVCTAPVRRRFNLIQYLGSTACADDDPCVLNSGWACSKMDFMSVSVLLW